jgi:hypothetical protein
VADIPECPNCGSNGAVVPKLLLIDDAWKQQDGVDPRERYFTSLRVDALRPEFRKGGKLEQFVDGWLCETCARGFVPDDYLIDSRWLYGPTMPAST